MKKQSMSERFWAKVDVRGDSECWEWKAAMQRGYGAFRISHGGICSLVNAHRVAYELAVGPIPDGKHVLHSCDNPPCCNPAHLRAGSRSDNMREAHERGRMPLSRSKHRLTMEERDALVYRLSGGESVRGLAREFGVSPATVRRYRPVKSGSGA